MSNIYIQEPSTSGKVLLTTTVGDIDIELWSKECPLACKNFIQHCENGYYEGTIFHRLIKNFIVQGGDPTGTGHGGESIYGDTFKDEFHSRLRFVRRGLVAMANAGPADNASQFFFTLDQCPELNNKHTIFGKVVGDTMFNMVKLADTPTDSNDRPQFPHKILKTKVLNSPFDDIVPRPKKSHKKSNKQQRESKSAATKDFTKLSFGEEAEEDETNCDVEDFKSVKSIHDCSQDKKLSKDIYEPPIETKQAKKVKEIVSEDENNDTFRVEPIDNEISKLDKIRNEFKDLKSEMKSKKQAKEIINEKKENNKHIDDHYASLVQIRKEKMQPKGSKREQQTMMMLKKFKSKMHDHQRLKKTETEGDANKEENDDNWLSHNLKFEEDAPLVENDNFVIQDPRKTLKIKK